MADMTTGVITYRAAVAEGIAREMRRDPSVVCLGEDIGAAGGVFKTMTGLYEEFGPDRVRDTPISEQAIVGAAMGAAMTGLRPVAEIMFSDFLACCWDYIANEIPKVRYMTGGQVTVPLVVRTANGGGLGFGAQHSQAVENWALAVPGLKVAAPATPADVIGLLAAAIRSDDPVVFFEHKALLAGEGPLPPPDHVVELGRARTAREGDDITIVALASTVPTALAAADELAAGDGTGRGTGGGRGRGTGGGTGRGAGDGAGDGISHGTSDGTSHGTGDRSGDGTGDGISAEVIDLRCLVPLDMAAVLRSVERTSRLLIVEENPYQGGWGGTIASIAADEGFELLDAPIKRVAGACVPLPFADALEKQVIPGVEKVVAAARALARY